MSIPERIVLVHKGALGDFIQVWPSLLSLLEHWPDRPLVWAGRNVYWPWIRPLGIQPCTPAEANGVNALYSAATWPPALQKALVVWFGLVRPPAEHPFERLWFIPGLEAAAWRPPREVYAEYLVQKGIQPAKDWPAKWRQLFAVPQPSRQEPTSVLLVPGAGHPAKCWPLAHYLQLAQTLVVKGMRVCFLLGPAELERGLKVKNFERIIPEDLPGLHSAIQEFDLVLGNDSGPLHLSAALGRPTLALFGPTSARQWGPCGARTLSLNLDCSPCSRLGRIECPDPQCLHRLSPERVVSKVEMMLEECRLD